MKIALVYDRVNKWGGAERVLLALHEIWPEAPLYTAVYDAKRASWAKVFKIKTSFLQHIPLAKSYHELYPWLTPLAFETFTFDEFDVVISVTSAEAKGIITKPKTLHICYCLTPTRYLWSGYEQYQTNPGMGALSGLARVSHAALAPTLRRWDLVAASRPDYYLAISQRVAARIKKYYKREVESIIYPPVSLRHAGLDPASQRDSGSPYQSTGQAPVGMTVKKGFFLTVSRLVGYKRVDIVIEAFNKLGWPLVIIGDGLQKNELKAKAGSNVTFIDHHLTESELVDYYRNCRAFVYAGDEDFGIVAVEAAACGKPVIAYRESGIAEFVKDGVTGILFSEQTASSLEAAVKKLTHSSFDPDVCRSQAERFSKKRFMKEMKETVGRLYKTHQP